MTDTEENFRTRNARVKRSKTRARILAAALILFEERGIDATTIDDVRHAAHLSRGSIYNYFPTFNAMLRAMAQQMIVQLNREQSASFDALPNPIERICFNVRYSIRRISSDRVGAGILLRVLPLIGPPTAEMQEHALGNITRAADDGFVHVPSLQIALEIGYGLVTALVQRGMTSGITPQEVDAGAQMLLRSFGVADDEARRIANLTLPALPDTQLRQVLMGDFSADEMTAMPARAAATTGRRASARR
ncbi:TetR/AcrR family transcriptional regulator [Sphingomonas bacterium]|uniref:TetR/AcrR family transcriptional regulator n=1 Tax=Sphingomonas bacterium TaxID=1895847 RepID=UPI00262290B9|nr:TetR/AcrR family transcriptional regulator [Sphingomonas bacterium]MDB5677931.1 transcriptional regulator, TetR family [Sphingomonas bacterium]